MEVRREKQINPVADEVLAITAVVRPIITGVLNALKADVVREVGGYENVKLKMLPRLIGLETETSVFVSSMPFTKL